MPWSIPFLNATCTITLDRGLVFYFPSDESLSIVTGGFNKFTLTRRIQQMEVLEVLCWIQSVYGAFTELSRKAYGTFTKPLRGLYGTLTELLRRL